MIFPGRRRSGFGILFGFGANDYYPGDVIKKKIKKNFKINKIKLGGMILMLYLCVNKKRK
jgi:hypothetical protein